MIEKLLEKMFNKVEKKSNTCITILGQKREKYNHELIIESERQNSTLTKYFKDIKGLRSNIIF